MQLGLTAMQTELHTLSVWLQQFRKIINQYGEVPLDEIMQQLYELRVADDLSKTYEFGSAATGLINAEAMAKRHRKVVLEGKEGGQLEVGTALRTLRLETEDALMLLKKNARMARWRQVGKVKGLPSEPVRVDGMLCVGDVYFVALLRSSQISQTSNSVVPCVVITVNKKSKNALRPHAQLLMSEVETVGLAIMKPQDSGRWKIAFYFLLNKPQLLLHKLHPPKFYVDKNTYTGHITMTLNGVAEACRQQYMAIVLNIILAAV
jgi:hypothetical protein